VLPVAGEMGPPRPNPRQAPRSHRRRVAQPLPQPARTSVRGPCALIPRGIGHLASFLRSSRPLARCRRAPGSGAPWVALAARHSSEQAPGEASFASRQRPGVRFGAGGVVPVRRGGDCLSWSSRSAPACAARCCWSSWAEASPGVFGSAAPGFDCESAVCRASGRNEPAAMPGKAAVSRIYNTAALVRWEARRREPAAVCQQSPVMRSAQLGDRRR
jgi:hypothetical protein